MIIFELLSRLGADNTVLYYLLLVIELIVFITVFYFFATVPVQLKRIADALNGNKIVKKKGNMSKNDDITMYVDSK